MGFDTLIVFYLMAIVNIHETKAVSQFEFGERLRVEVTPRSEIDN